MPLLLSGSKPERKPLAKRSNPPLQGTPEKLRFSVPSALRAPVAPYLER